MGSWTATPRTWVAGEVPTAANFNSDVRDFGRAFADAWTSYTPTLTAASSNPTNWTAAGYYVRAGKLVIAKFVLTAGASMTNGSGTYRVALPVNAGTTLGDYEMGVAAGGQMKQKIYPDPYVKGDKKPSDIWKSEPSGVVMLHLLSSEDFFQVTGYCPPPTPITKEEYERRGYPWFEMVDGHMGDTEGSDVFDKVKPVTDGKKKKDDPYEKLKPKK